MPKIKRLSKIFILFVTLPFLVSCAQTTVDPTAPTPEGTAVGIVYESASALLLPTYYDLAQYSDIVIIGKVQSEVGVINSARDPKNSTVPDPRFFTVVQVYLVEVERYLKGEGEYKIYLGQKEGRIIHGNTPSPDEIELARVSSENEVYIPLRSDLDYLMFLRSVDVWDDYDIAGLEKGKFFGGMAHPWLFDATDQNRVIVVDVLSEVGKMFSPQPLSEILKQMDNPDMAPPTAPYPPPMGDPLDQSQPTKSSYPAP